jgi:hypothetical protein
MAVNRVAKPTLVMVLLASVVVGACSSESGNVRGGLDAVGDVSAAEVAELDAPGRDTVSCEAGTRTCDGLAAVLLCAADGRSYQRTPCGEGTACVEGDCAPVQCTPGRSCEGGLRLDCDGTGTQKTVFECPGKEQCIEGDCRPILHNVVLLFDTSSSMNACVDDENKDYVDCCPAGCPEEWPVCETFEAPLSKLGVSKKVFKEFLDASLAVQKARFALLTFPQTEAVGHSFCYSGYYLEQASITGDDESHATPPPPTGWFHQNLAQVVRVPFASGWSTPNYDQMVRWIDFTEVQHENPELRASGFTPLGKSMFYAGEYFRHYLVVDGKPCAVDADCGSVDYVCQEGSCRDPVKECRANILLVFTDGKESNYTVADEFFNPMVQARRMAFGLGCSDTSGCAGGAQCVNGFCERHPTVGADCVFDADCPPGTWCEADGCHSPGFEWPTTLGKCNSNGVGCIVGAPQACPEMFEACKKVDPRVADPDPNANVLRAYDGSPIGVTVHVINVSEDLTESRLIAEHGGGRHFDVNLAQADILLQVLKKVVDLKSGEGCSIEVD